MVLRQFFSLSIILAGLIDQVYPQSNINSAFPSPSVPSTTIYHRILDPLSIPPPFTERGVLENSILISDPNLPPYLHLNRGEIYQIGIQRSHSGVQGEILYSFIGIPAVSCLKVSFTKTELLPSNLVSLY